ncbi:F-box/LRR-repeat protein 18 [Folsomia candida]|uniref:F-box/LRR-repeat protein 18 n=1 Tax=Folsomia candida TaxID=158441 RepID=A0A226E4Z2_FOLCA|nr:F-box/LRR-repeat protein 18 [Folsomia candida]
MMASLLGSGDEMNYLTERLSDETLLHIFQHIHTHDDFIRLSETCHRLNELLKDKDFCCRIFLPWYSNLRREMVFRFFRDRVRVAVISQLDFSDLYWLPSGIIRDLVTPMTNLQIFLAAGTCLSWAHLSQLLKCLPIKKLSWSWDNCLEESCRRRSSVTPTKFSEITEMEDAFLRLTSLLIHIPMMTKTPTDVLFYSYSALEYLVSLCLNLEELWFISWPKSSAERKSSSSSYSRREFDGLESALTKLHTLVISVKGPPRFSPMSFFRKLISTFGVVTPAQVFWCDHPLLGILNNETQYRLGQARYCWFPQICSETAVRLSYPMVAILEAARENFSYPKLRAVSLSCSDGEIGDHSVAFSKLTYLEKLSVSIDCLFEIRDSSLLSEYMTLQHLDDKLEATTDYKPEKMSELKPPSKKRRVGAASKLLVNGIPNKTDPTTGLHFIARRCSKINELELGYSGLNQAKAGRIVLESLSCISNFKFLRKLSLSSIPITNGKFLIQICSKCDIIESLRLTHLGPSAKCCYVQDLCQALPLCRNTLKDFRLEQNYIGSPLAILKALKKCSNIRRLLIWSSPNDHALEFEPVDCLFQSCKDLTVFYATIESTTKADCFKFRKALEARYKAERPALSIVLRRTLEEEELIHYPSIHYREIVINATQVCQYKDFSNFNS